MSASIWLHELIPLFERLNTAIMKARKLFLLALLLLYIVQLYAQNLLVGNRKPLSVRQN